MATLTKNQQEIVDSIIKEFEKSNAMVKKPSEFPFFDELIHQSEKDRLEIEELKRRYEIGKRFIKEQIKRDYEKLKPYIDRCDLAITISDNSIRIGRSYDKIRGGLNICEYNLTILYKDKTRLRNFPSGRHFYEYIGYVVCDDYGNVQEHKSIEDLLNWEKFQNNFKRLYNR